MFETNSATGDEVIVLKSRKGLIKLAFRTGASLVPCYLFGNTKLFSLFTGGSLHSFFKRLSRKLGTLPNYLQSGVTYAYICFLCV